MLWRQVFRSYKEKALILMCNTGKSRDGLYEPVLAESEREAVADLLQYLENVCLPFLDYIYIQRLMICSVARRTSSRANP